MKMEKKIEVNDEGTKRKKCGNVVSIFNDKTNTMAQFDLKKYNRNENKLNLKFKTSLDFCMNLM